MEDKKDYANLGKLEWSLIIASFVLILFSFFAPSIFVQSTFLGIDFSGTGAIGDTLGGIMNPFIGIAGVLLTFLAFYIQYKANKQQRQIFRQELDSNKFENQFYEMLKLHKDNVNEISLNLESEYFSGKESYKVNERTNGRESFKYFLEEIRIIYEVVGKVLDPDSPNERLNKSYQIFFHGINEHRKDFKKTDPPTPWKEILNSLDDINKSKKTNKTAFQNVVFDKSDYRPLFIPNYDLFQGHSAKLAHYYRHLYQTVKYITKQPEDRLSYEEKRNYLRILRSQLSNQEQAMLFYNWKSDFGRKWENSENKYFTDYRMIHNLYNDILISDFKLEEIFDLESSVMRREKGRENDSLFEFQDW